MAGQAALPPPSAPALPAFPAVALPSPDEGGTGAPVEWTLQLTAAGRIYAPVAYASARERAIIPIVHIEAMPLAAWFPVAWYAYGDQQDLVVLRSLLPDGRGQPTGSPRDFRSLPLALRAFPFKLAGAEGATRLTVQIERELADAPTDIGASIWLAQGKLSRGAELKLRALGLVTKHLPASRAMSSYLMEHHLLTAWPLSFDLEGTKVVVEGLSVIDKAAFDDGRLGPFVERFGSAGAELLMAHRLSLFRAGVLVASARAALKAHAKQAEAS